MVPVLDKYFQIYEAIFKKLGEKIAFPDTDQNRAWLAAGNSAEFIGFCLASGDVSGSEIEKNPGFYGHIMQRGHDLWEKGDDILGE